MPRAFLMSTKNKSKNVKADDLAALERAKDAAKTVRTSCDARRKDEEQETSPIDLDRLKKEENDHTKYVNETNMTKVWQPFNFDDWMKSAKNESRAKVDFFEPAPVSFRCGSRNLDPFAFFKGFQRIQSTLAVRSSRTGYAINESSDYNYDDYYDNDDDERCRRARNVDTIVQDSENIKPLKSQSSDSSVLEPRRNSERKAIAFNPFVNCPPLTSDVDTGRLYPKNRSDEAERCRTIAPLTISRTNRNGGSGRHVVQTSPAASSSSSSVKNCPFVPLSSQYSHQHHPYQSSYHLQTKIRVTDFVYHRRYLTFPSPPTDQCPPGANCFDPRGPPEVRGYHAMAEADTKEPEDDRLLPKASAASRFQCSSCLKSYSTANGLSKHREFHCPASSGGGSLPRQKHCCHQCDKAYTSVSALKMHIRTHTLPCRCKVCGKAFSRPWLLQGHLRTHTGEKPFQCMHCGRAFADRSNLRAHLQTHYDVKQYNCQTCHKTFSRMSLLLKHRHNSCA